MTIAQGANVTRPRFAEMPSSAVAAGIVDLELPVETIPERIIGYVRNWGSFDTQHRGDALTTIFNLLRTRTGHDFREYKERTFQRRVQRRMQVVQTTKLEDYAERLQREPDEVSALFRDLLIGVTDFFRDAAAFQALEKTGHPKAVRRQGWRRRSARLGSRLLDRRGGLFDRDLVARASRKIVVATKGPGLRHRH